MNAHMRIHNSTKFTCQECGKSFQLASYLRKHLLRHSGVKKFHCVICNKQYAQPVDLRLHLKKIHGIDKKTDEKNSEN